MLTLILTIATGILVAWIALMKSRTPDGTKLNQPRPVLLAMGVQIICGDCSGQEDLPVKTYLDRLGNCSLCGGRSYVLASIAAMNRAAPRAARNREACLTSNRSRVIAFELPNSASRRIAI
ncbi:MAG TPA: hypothetical protein VLM38_02470 [Blastocatellia bacterium]|nr:hypothetical protein [Blastocatellia bacterium]